MSDSRALLPQSQLAHHLGRLSGLQWKLFSLFLTIGVLGLGGVVWSHFNSVPPAPKTVSTPAIPADHSAFVDAKPSGKASADSETDETEASQRSAFSWSQWFSDKGARLGFGFAGGFVFGFIFRAFLRITTIIVGAILLLLGALSYFNVLNVDLSAVETGVKSNAEWLTSQAWHLKTLVMQHLPSSTTGTVGLLVGMKRR